MTKVRRQTKTHITYSDGRQVQFWTSSMLAAFGFANLLGSRQYFPH